MNDILYVFTEKTQKGFPTLWVGGGATSNRFSATFVLRNGGLAPASFIRTSRFRSNNEQALVPLQKGDILVGVEGFLPASPDNPVIGIHGWKVKGFKIGGDDDNILAITESVDVSVDDIPSSVWEGCNILYNLDGRYFVSE
jgi:hypothetical protein